MQRKTGLIIGGLVAVVLIGVGAVIAVIAVAATRNHSSTPPVAATSSTATTAQRTDEQLLRDAVNTLDITGDKATANVSQGGKHPQDIEFAREDGGWKWCKSEPGIHLGIARAEFIDHTEAMRFNQPPNWPPVPPGWTPPPGWQPDPSWPPPPPGWLLWTDDAAGPAGTSSGKKKGLIIGGIAAAVVAVLVVVGVVVAIFLNKDGPTVTSSSTSTTKAASDEDQIKDVVKRFQSAWNDKDFSGFQPIVCKEMRDAKEFNESDFLAAREDSDDMSMSVESVAVDGDSATVSIKPASASPRDVTFAREQGHWTWCDN